MLLVGLLLAGCAGESPVINDQQPTEAAPVGPEVSPDKGAIEGIVLDSSLLPVAGAEVSLKPLGAKAETLAVYTTLEDGVFVFSLLDPATYNVEASREGFGDAAVFADVRLDEVTQVTMHLNEVPGDEPYVDIQPWTGIVNCGFAAVLWSDNCGVGPPIQAGSLQHQYNITAGHQAILIETTWAGVDYMDNWIRWRPQGTKDWFYYGFSIGQPVLRKEILPLSKAEHQNSPTLPPKDFAASDQPAELLVQTFYDGRMQKEANGTALYTACRELMGYCAGAGLALELRFNQFVSTFVNARPADLSTYSVLPDQ